MSWNQFVHICYHCALSIYLTLDLSLPNTHFFILFVLTNTPRACKKSQLRQKWELSVCFCACVCACEGSCSVPLNGGHRSVKMCLQKLLSAADRWPTGPWIACLTFRAAYQPVFPIVVAHWKTATCSPTTVINEDDFFFFFFVTQPKRGGIDIWGWGVNR